MLRPAAPNRRLLSEVAEHVGGTLQGPDVEVLGVTLSSTDLRAGELFVGIRGANRHGADFAAQAAANGAAAVLTDAEGAAIAVPAGLPIVVVDDPRGVLGEAAMLVHRTSPRDELPLLLGTTGTNGKTSVTHLLEGLLTQIGVVAGASTSAERVVAGERVVSGLTSPEATEFHALLALMRERGVEAFAVEVSAQAITRRRLEGVVFDVAAFTNLTHDHLDDYGDMETYYAAKAPFFTRARSRRAVVSLDSAPGFRILDDAEVPVTTIAARGIASAEALERADWIVEVTREQQSGTSFTLTHRDGRSLATVVPVIGAHMAANAGLAILMMLEAGYAWERIVEALERDGGIRAWVPGRTQLVSGPEGPAVYVDFGHTPDAFEKTLAAVRRVTPGRVLMLFGADGDRDALKRPDMARTAVEGSDITVITDHHPRFENAADIRRVLVDSARATDPQHELYEVSPPEDAIVKAVSLVGPGDAILWAGPGHQNYRDIEGVQYAYSARELARRALIDAGWPAGERTWPDPYED
jgi:UDP-N-acetylmuramoyl-L-alanyl-D-glutamate--2,6-diaminopimelate ligase